MPIESKKMIFLQRMTAFLILMSMSIVLAACGSDVTPHTQAPTALESDVTGSDAGTLTTVAGQTGVNPPKDAPPKTIFKSGEIVGWMVHWRGFVSYERYVIGVEYAEPSSYPRTPVPGTTISFGYIGPIDYLSGTFPVTFPPGHYRIYGLFGPAHTTPGGAGGSGAIGSPPPTYFTVVASN